MNRSLNIGMRIGVHSGTLFAGVIGKAKLQYDIWGMVRCNKSMTQNIFVSFPGADVNIASRLEATGSPGYVHVSGRTLSSLNAEEYNIYPGTESAQKDPVLQKHPMSTYLLTAIPSLDSDKTISIVEGVPNLDLQTVGSNRKSQILKPNLLSHEMREEFRKMPVGGFK